MEKELTGNEKIAIFSNAYLVADGPLYSMRKSIIPSDVYGMYCEFGSSILPCRLRFDKSWDWLMPIVEKIESFGFTVTIEDKSCVIDRPENINLLIGANAASKIEAVYKAVLEFIDWYNKQEK